jgi:hypothetical protein
MSSYAISASPRAMAFWQLASLGYFLCATSHISLCHEQLQTFAQTRLVMLPFLALQNRVAPLTPFSHPSDAFA